MKPEAEFMNEQFRQVLRLEVSVFNVFIANQSRNTFAGGGGGEVKSVVKVTVKCKELGKLLRLLSQIRPRIRPRD